MCVFARPAVPGNIQMNVDNFLLLLGVSTVSACSVFWFLGGAVQA